MRKKKKSIIALLLVVLMISSVIDYSGVLKVDAKEQSTQAAGNTKVPEENKDTTVVSSYGTKLDGGNCGESGKESSVKWAIYADQDIQGYIIVISGSGRMADHKGFRLDGLPYSYWVDGKMGYRVKKIIVEEGVTYLGMFSFFSIGGDKTTLERVVLPKSLTEIGHNCFYGNKNLTAVFYAGTEAEYNNISNLKSGFYRSSDFDVYYRGTGDLKKIDANEATCIKPGNKEYYMPTDGTIAFGTNTIDMSQAKIPSDFITTKKHNIINVTIDGRAECSDCGGTDIIEGVVTEKDGVYKIYDSVQSAINATRTQGTKIMVLGDDIKCGDNAYWSLVKNESGYTLTITGSGAIYDYQDSASSDSTLKAPYISYADSINALSISGEITQIGEYAFDKLTNIRTYYCEKTELLEAIKNSAMSNWGDCSATDLVIYDGTNLGTNIFSGTTFNKVRVLIKADATTHITREMFYNNNITGLDSGVPAEFEVAFNPGEGVEPVATQYVQINGDANAKVTKPDTPDKGKGWVFRGWYTDENCTDGNEFDCENDIVDKPMTLYAKWCDHRTITKDGDVYRYACGEEVTTGAVVTKYGSDDFTYYEDFKDAVSAAMQEESESDNVLELLGDAVLTSPVKIERRTLTINLNGKTISASNCANFDITESAVTFDDKSASGKGAVINTGEYENLMQLRDATLVINKGTFKNTSSQPGALILQYNDGSSITVNDGTFYSGADRCIDAREGDIEAVINGGRFESTGTKSAIYVKMVI